MSKTRIEDLREQIRQKKLDRPGLIKALRKTRMEAINKGDTETLGIFGEDPVEVVADRIIAEERSSNVPRRA